MLATLVDERMKTEFERRDKLLTGMHSTMTMMRSELEKNMSALETPRSDAGGEQVGEVEPGRTERRRSSGGSRDATAARSTGQRVGAGRRRPRRRDEAPPKSTGGLVSSRSEGSETPAAAADAVIAPRRLHPRGERSTERQGHGDGESGGGNVPPLAMPRRGSRGTVTAGSSSAPGSARQPTARDSAGRVIVDENLPRVASVAKSHDALRKERRSQQQERKACVPC